MIASCQPATGECQLTIYTTNTTGSDITEICTIPVVIISYEPEQTAHYVDYAETAEFIIAAYEQPIDDKEQPERTEASHAFGVPADGKRVESAHVESNQLDNHKARPPPVGVSLAVPRWSASQDSVYQDAQGGFYVGTQSQEK